MHHTENGRIAYDIQLHLKIIGYLVLVVDGWLNYTRIIRNKDTKPLAPRIEFQGHTPTNV